ncbi:cleavage polyadenylation factor subunit fip1 [Coniosporium tulheliwenetii]|uniref:Cleavage polyadenylation factor subunit fip1 n=1 Tax=Coniosporium tulheliwenetii TaxID=3383036 RepID=A0ACC2ZBD7_9PEZI|nr:cleavage polyadenylation factor subunit fip1 [Cladosporium sp. JES 115]
MIGDATFAWATSDITLPSSPTNAPKPPPTTSNSTTNSADPYISTLLLTSSDLVLLQHKPFAPNRETMEEEDDDFYGPNEGSEAPNGGLKAPAETNGQPGARDVKAEEGLESGEEGEEEESSDSDIDIITERKDGPGAEHTPPDTPPPPNPPPLRAALPAHANPPPPNQFLLLHRPPPAPTRLKDGSTYPEIRTSTIDVNADPIYPPARKPITAIEIDVDLAEHTKPWRLPGADQSDFFNYGFDEFTWEMYRLKQQNMAKVQEEQKAETKHLEMFLTGGGGMPGAGSMPGAGGLPQVPAAPSVPTGPSSHQQAPPQQPPVGPGGASGMGGMGGMQMPGMAGMPGMEDPIMQQVMQHIMASGMDFSQIGPQDFEQLYRQIAAQQGGGGAGPPQGPVQAAQAAYGGQQGYGAQGQWGQQQQQGGYGRGGRGGRRY